MLDRHAAVAKILAQAPAHYALLDRFSLAECANYLADSGYPRSA